MGDAPAITEVADEQLGDTWRKGMKAEVRAVPSFLREGEQVARMAFGTAGKWWRAGIFVATDSRVLLIHQWLPRHPRCTEIRFTQIRLLDDAPEKRFLYKPWTSKPWKLLLEVSGERQTWELHPTEAGGRFVRFLAEHAEDARVQAGDRGR